MHNMIGTEGTPACEKPLNFAPDLVPLVTERSKTSTWRIGDDKDLSEGDILIFFSKGKTKDGEKVEGKTPFAKAKVVNVVEKPF